MSEEMLRIHGNCQHYKFNQSEPSKRGCCQEGNRFPLPMFPIAPGCDKYVEKK